MGVNGVPGASHRGWRQYFPNAQIWGADIDKNILFKEDRIKTFYCDQRDPAAINAMWSAIAASSTNNVNSFDIIIDDGLHEFDANVCFCLNSIGKLAPGGVLIVEDIKNHYVPQWLKQIQKWQEIFTDYEFLLVHLPLPWKETDNRLLLIKHV